MNWQKLFNYCEVMCFASAWAVALLVAMSADRAASSRSTRSIARSDGIMGMQATLAPANSELATRQR